MTPLGPVSLLGGKELGDLPSPALAMWPSSYCLPCNIDNAVAGADGWMRGTAVTGPKMKGEKETVSGLLGLTIQTADILMISCKEACV